jgi:hypothetical protein
VKITRSVLIKTYQTYCSSRLKILTEDKEKIDQSISHLVGNHRDVQTFRDMKKEAIDRNG